MTIIIGKTANLSRALASVMEDVVLVPSLTPIETLKKLSFTNPINIIFNNFQKSTKIYDLSEPISFLQRSLSTTVEVLNYIKDNNIPIKKILYTSSSSVYGNNHFCTEDDILNPMNFPASLKITNEKFIELFCREHNYEYTICRLFNMYGGKDEFSIISKIINHKKNPLTLYNDGLAVRDFIHIDNVVQIYVQLLSTIDIPIINIASSKGISVKEMLDFLEKKGCNISYDNIVVKEIEISIANTTLLNQKFPYLKYMNIQEYIFTSIREEIQTTK